MIKTTNIGDVMSSMVDDIFNNAGFNIFTPDKDLCKAARYLLEDDMPEKRVSAVELSRSIMPYNYFYEITNNTSENGTEKTVTQVFQIACAGYDKSNIKIQAKDNVLSVEFNKEENKEDSEDSNKKVYVVRKLLKDCSGKMKWLIKNLSAAEIDSSFINGVLEIRIKEKPIVDNVKTIEIH